MVGQTILHYQILQKLGAGGMGDIYKAQDGKLNRVVAIKVLSGASSGDPESRRRFIQEAQAASSLNHPNIITIHDIVSQGNDQFMVMEFVNGRTLGDLIPMKGLSAATTLHYAVQIADGLNAAHTAGIVHRDLKPGNIMVTPQELVKILDFGLAKLTVPAGPVSLSDVTLTAGPAPLTVEGSIIGTVSYMSPEQAQGAKVDARSDIFSFGCVLYETVTGRKAFQDESSLLTLTAILRDEPRPVTELTPNVPLELATLIHRAIRKDPNQRWQSMQEMHAELVRLKQRSDAGILIVEKLPPPKPKAWSAPGSLPGILVATILLASAIGGVWWWNSHRASKPAPPAQSSATAKNPNAPPKPSALSPPILTNQSILDMAQAHVPTSVMISQIRSSKTNFDLSTAELIRLTKGGVTEQVIQAMRNPAGAPPGTVAAASGKAAVPSRTVQVIGGQSFEIILMENVIADCKPGQALSFQAAKDVMVGDTVVVSKGAAVSGVVAEGAKKKFLVHTTRPTFRLLEVAAADGSKLKVRATSGRLGESRKDPPLEPVGGLKSKDAVAPAGSRFLAYFDGDQSVELKK